MSDSAANLHEVLNHQHRPGESCDICDRLRADFEAIRESEREAWRRTRDIIID